MEQIRYDIVIKESPVGITFGHSMQDRILQVAKVNPERIAAKLGVLKGDQVLEVAGVPVTNSKVSLAHFRELSRAKKFPIKMKMLREKLIDLSAVLEAHEQKKKEASDRRKLAEATFNSPPLLYAEVSYGGLWFPARVQKENADFFSVTFLYSEIALQHDLVGQSSIIPSNRVRLSTLESLKSTFNDMGDSVVKGFEDLQNGLVEDPVGYLGVLGKASVSASVSWASSKLQSAGSWFGGYQSQPEPEVSKPVDPSPPSPAPKKSTYQPSTQAAYPVKQSAYPVSQAAYPVKQTAYPVTQSAYPVYPVKKKAEPPITQKSNHSFDPNSISPQGIDGLFRKESEDSLTDDQKLIEQFMAESALLRAQLQQELDKELGDL